MAVNKVGVADLIVGGPLVAAGFAAAGTAVLTASEVATRAISILTTSIMKLEMPKNFGPEKEKGWFSENVIDFRKLTRNLEAKDLFKTLAVSVVATIILREISFRLFGPTIKGVNMFGRFVGLQTTNNGVVANLHFADWREFFHRQN